jgi:hypothetical protein
MGDVRTNAVSGHGVAWCYSSYLVATPVRASVPKPAHDGKHRNQNGTSGNSLELRMLARLPLRTLYKLSPQLRLWQSGVEDGEYPAHALFVYGNAPRSHRTCSPIYNPALTIETTLLSERTAKPRCRIQKSNRKPCYDKSTFAFTWAHLDGKFWD